MLERLRSWWRARTLREQGHVVLVAAFTILAVIHQLVVWSWYIEDAAISFAYARHLATGEGLVAYAGGERVEGYSNPSWVFLLAALDLLGWGPFSASKWLQLVLAAVTVPATWALTRHAVDDPDSDAPVYAAAALAANTQFAVWGGSGLENALYNAVLVGALWRTAVELRDGRAGLERWPGSALLWLLLALTRPEAVVQAAIGGVALLGFTLVDGRGIRPVARWLAAFLVPFAAYHAARYAYFQWPLPQTYYAKIGEHREPEMVRWDGQGWRYLRNWAMGVGHGYLIPVYVLGLTGARGRHALLGLSLAFLWSLAALLPSDQRLLLPVVLVFTWLLFLALIRGPDDSPRPLVALAGLVVVGAFVGAAEWMRARGATSDVPSPLWVTDAAPWVTIGFGALVPLLGWGRPGARMRTLCWALLCAGLLFSVLVHGDWMRGWRWMNLVAVPGSVVLGVGVEVTARFAQATLVRAAAVGPVAWAAAAILVLAPVPANVLHTKSFRDDPVTGPFAVRQRVVYKNQIKERLHWYGPLVDLDVDMGAHLFWAPDHQMMDIAGLVDIPFAQHRFERHFVKEYVFVERKPLFAHIHGGWASNSKIPSNPEWKQGYVELPGYPTGDDLHIGNFLRRDALFADAWPGAGERRVGFERGVELVGWRVPASAVAANRRLYLELALQAHDRVDRPFRVLAFLVGSDGSVAATWDLPPAYDWVPLRDWRSGEIFVGRFSPPLPADLPVGTYELGLLLLDGGGHPLLPTADRTASVVVGEAGTARLAVGEIRFPDAVQVRPEAEVEAASEAERTRALEAAAAGDCEGAVSRWATARAHRPRDEGWTTQAAVDVHRAVADCHVRRAEAEPDRAVAALVTARLWDRLAPALVATADRTADQLVTACDAAIAAADWEAGYRACADAVAVDPTRARARRLAEHARAERLAGTDEELRAAEKAESERRALLRKRRAGEVD